MKLRNDFSYIDELMRRMGATTSSWSVGARPLNPRERLQVRLEAGIEIPLAEVKPEHGGLLTYAGEQVLLYIKDTRKSRYMLLHEPENAPRFHVADCQTLQWMRAEGRYERYVVTNRTTGVFLVESLDPYTRVTEELDAKLHVCKNCLAMLNYELYNDLGKRAKDSIWKCFSLEQFFGSYATFFQAKPRHSDETAPRGGYAPDFARVSMNIRAKRNWTCDICRVKLDRDRGLLHCHHKNGVLSDNSPRNLQALCILCHSEQPSHQHMRVSTKAQMRIHNLRREQGIFGAQTFPS